jgi:hypothetical protein
MDNEMIPLITYLPEENQSGSSGKGLLSEAIAGKFGVGELREVSQRDRYIPKFEIMDK